MEALVSPQWVAHHLTTPGFVLLDATLRKTVNTTREVTEGVIPGAVYVDLDATFSDPESPLPHTLPSTSRLAALLSDTGITTDSTVVVYDQQGIYSSPRVWWMLRMMGVGKSFVLDGGLGAWREAGYGIAENHALPVRKIGEFKVKPGQVVDKFTVLENIAAPRFQMIDARPEARFSGHQAEPRAGLRRGHIPGAINLPFSTVLKEGRYMSRESLADLFCSHGLTDNDELVFSCGSGVTACIVLFAAHLAGLKRLRLYDGSWAEWGQDDTLPLRCNRADL
ncbi:sulfurtransferase [Erwinia tasmaniensis]|uniref:sulfurtransferase n=1 Tax=Erwinia tasmaniensis TaxID=338565 RepID=UPI003A4DFDD7